MSVFTMVKIPYPYSHHFLRRDTCTMKTTKITYVATFLAFTLACASAKDKDTAKDANNTGRNKQDQEGKTKTPMDQSNSAEDIKLVSTIRKAIVKDKSLSSLAKNCKIITNGGHVTLRGPVNTAEEKSTIANHAVASASKEKVDNQLEVKARQ